MSTNQQSDRGTVHRPLAVGAVGLAVVLLVAGASLARLGRGKIEDAAQRGARKLAEQDLEARTATEAEHRARLASAVLERSARAAHALAAHVGNLGPSSLAKLGADFVTPSPFAFGTATSQALPWFESADESVAGLAADPAAGVAELAALAFRGRAVAAFAEPVRAQIPEQTYVSVWVRDEGIIVQPAISAARVTEWLRPHAGFGAALLSLSDPAEAGWLSADEGPNGGRTLPYVVPLLDAEGHAWAVVRCDVALDDVLASIAPDSATNGERHPLLFGARSEVMAASDGALRAMRVDDFTALRAALTPLLGELGGSPRTHGDAHTSVVGDVIVSCAPIAGVNWSLGVVAPRESVRSAVALAANDTADVAGDFAMAIVGFCALFGLLAAGAGLGFAQILRQRLAALVEAAQAHADGQPSLRTPTDSNDEISAIGLALNASTLRMQENVRRLDESRRRLSGLIQNMAEGLVITDADDRVTFANARFAEILRRPGSGLVGHFLEEFLVPQSLDSHRAELARRRDGANTRFEVTWRNVGSAHPQTLVAAMPLFDADGRYTGSCGVVTDNSKRAYVQGENARADKLRALGEMAGGVAHDFNNVLTAVLGNTQYLLNEDINDEMRETLRIIETAALDGTQTVNRIRKFTKPSAGVQHAGPVDANSAALDILRMARPRFEHVAQQRGVEYEVIVQREALREIRGNASEVREVLLNLVFNALEAMPDGGTLTMETFDRGEDAVGIRIADTGQGIPEEHLDKIFDPFFSTKRGGRCSGLGLSICFGIIRAHGGQIDVRSEPGIGTTFTVVLPAFRERHADRSDAGGHQPPPDPCVLVVSGRRRPAVAMQRGLSLRGLHVALVDNATVALDLLGDPGIFNTLVVEYELAGQSGWELARAARRARPDLRIVVMTDTQRPVDDTQARNAGIDRVLARPFDTEDVEGVILRALAIPVAELPTDNQTDSGARTRGARRVPQIREIWGELVDSAATRIDPVATEM